VEWLQTAWGWAQNDAAVAGLRIAGVLIVAALLTVVLRRAVKKVENKVAEHTTPIRAMQRTRTLTKVLSSAGVALIWFFALLYVLRALSFDLAPLLTGVGIVGLAVGFGAQNLVRDVVSGLFVLIEDQYGVGDIITINGGPGGVVEQLTLRVTGVRDADGTMHFVANGAITEVANSSKGWARAVVDVPVDYSEDPERVRAVLEEVARTATEMPDIGRKLYGEAQVLGVESFGDFKVQWRMVADTKPGRQYEVTRALREQVKVAFDRADIKSPARVMVGSAPAE
jgi:small conductance mechanosensitive channel